MSKNVEETCIEFIRESLRLDADTVIKPETDIIMELDGDSLDVIEIVIDIEENYDIWISEGIATKKGKIISVDLKKMGYDKLLGTGSTEKTYKLTVNSASAKAVQKIESAGGEVING